MIQLQVLGMFGMMLHQYDFLVQFISMNVVTVGLCYIQILKQEFEEAPHDMKGQGLK